MVLPKEDTGTTNLGADFDFFCEHREEFMHYMNLDEDVVQFAFKLQELLYEDQNKNGNKFFERFLEHKKAGFKLIEQMSSVMHHNVEAGKEDATVTILEHLFLLSFLGLSRIEDRGLEKSKEKKKVAPQPQLQLDGTFADPCDEEPRGATIPKISEIEQDDCIFQIVTENGYRISVDPTSLDYYIADSNDDDLGNCWIAGNLEIDHYLGETVKLIRYTKNRILNLGEYTIDLMNGSQCLIKSITEDLTDMAVVNVRIPDALEFLRDPKLRIYRSDYIEKHGKPGPECVINGKYKSLTGGADTNLGRWKLSKTESDNYMLVFRPVKKTKKNLVNMIRKCFPFVAYNDANTAFNYYLNKSKTTKLPVTTVTKEEDLDIPDYIEKLGKKGTDTFELEFYSSKTQKFDIAKFNRVNNYVTEKGKIFIFSDVHNIDWKTASSIGNRLVRLKSKITSYDATYFKTNNKNVLESMWKKLGSPEIKTDTTLELWYRTSLFDEGLVLVPCDPEQDTEMLFPATYDFDSIQVEVNEMDYYPGENFKIHEISDLNGNIFVAFCMDNLQNYAKFLDREDFAEDAENTDYAKVIVNGKALGDFTDVHVIGDFVFMFAGDKTSKVYGEGIYHMGMYEGVYYLFKSTKPYRKGKLGLDKTVSYSDFQRKTTVGSSLIKKPIVKPPKRKESGITF